MIYKPHTKPQNLGKTQQKILLLLAGGLALGLTHSPKQYFKIIGAIKSDWRGIDTYDGKRAIRNLYERGYLIEKRQRDGSIELVPSKMAEERVEKLSLDKISIPFQKKIVWDGKWRIVIFDIPEKRKRSRDAFRLHLQNIGFEELQHSVFVFPFDCWKQVQMLVDFYKIGRCVNLLIADSISDDYAMRKKFKLAVKKS